MGNYTSEIDQLLQAEPIDQVRLVEFLVDQYYADIYRLALTILRDHADAEDVAQEALLIVLTRLEQYAHGTNFRAWLYTIVVNVSRGYLRKRHRRYSLNRLLGSLVSIEKPPPTPEESLQRNETELRLWQAVNTLNEKHRLPVILRYVQGLSIRDIAQILDLSEGTVRSRLYYAVRKLQGRMNLSDIPKLEKRKEVSI